MSISQYGVEAWSWKEREDVKRPEDLLKMNVGNRMEDCGVYNEKGVTEGNIEEKDNFENVEF